MSGIVSCRAWWSASTMAPKRATYSAVAQSAYSTHIASHPATSASDPTGTRTASTVAPSRDAEEPAEHGVTTFERFACHELAGGMGEGGIAGTEVERGHARRREAGNVGPPELRPHPEVEGSDQL